MGWKRSTMRRSTAHIVARTPAHRTCVAAKASGGHFERIDPLRRLMLLALAANAPCIGVLFTAGLPLVAIAALTAMRLPCRDVWSCCKRSEAGENRAHPPPTRVLTTSNPQSDLRHHLCAGTAGGALLRQRSADNTALLQQTYLLVGARQLQQQALPEIQQQARTLDAGKVFEMVRQPMV